MSLDEVAHLISHVDASVTVGGLRKDLFVAASDEPLKIRGCYRVSGSRVQWVVASLWIRWIFEDLNVGSLVRYDVEPDSRHLREEVGTAARDAVIEQVLYLGPTHGIDQNPIRVRKCCAERFFADRARRNRLAETTCG